jgi:uncharacterized protein involved in response to NO
MNFELIKKDPFRLFFPLGILFLVVGVLIWVPRIWDAENYPVLLHRSLVLNGFVACFIGGFLFTAVPRFSQTEFASGIEIMGLLSLILLSVCAGHFEREDLVFLFSGLTGLFILIFLARRMPKRKANPPYSFVFLFAGLLLWIISGISSYFGGGEEMKELLYHGAVMAIILGVGSRLLPGIMGHTEIVSAQKEKYERPVGLLKTIPPFFLFLMVSFTVSFFIGGVWAAWIPALVVLVIGMSYWQLWKLPVERSALTMCLWSTAWLIVLSYLLRAVWSEGMIHGSHAFFINGLVLLSLLIGTRVIQSHGPKDKGLENWKGLYVVTLLMFLSSMTRVSAYLLPERYLSHLGYASILLLLGVFLWAGKYLRYVLEVK